MDPLSALGVAGTVVQFVQFACALFDGTRKIYNSASGASNENERLEFIYTRLSDLSSRLGICVNQRLKSVRFVASELPKDAPSLADLAAKCREDCSQLLEGLDRMRIKNLEKLSSGYDGGDEIE